ncbi:MAG: hypothetical protein KGL39_15520 [Patescibacteria group bacterium]|nr:hypothetical protein [Patescibacteria group bacterium]
MKTSAALAYFKSQAKIAQQLGLSRAAINHWGDVVPLESALALETLTAGALPVDRSLYPVLARAKRKTG